MRPMTGTTTEIIHGARARLYNLHWQLRSRFNRFDLWEGLRC